MKHLTLTLYFLGGISFFFNAHAEAEAKKEIILKTGESWDGTPFPKYPEGEPEITITKVTLPVKASLPFHKHSFIHSGIVLKGEMTITTEGGKMKRLKAGDAISEVFDWHSATNTGKEEVEVIVFDAGIKGQPTIIKK